MQDGEVFEPALGVGAQPVLAELRVDRTHRRIGQVLHLADGIQTDFV